MLLTLLAQVSQSVVVLALLFIWKLQGKHAIDAKPGSEYKLTVVSSITMTARTCIYGLLM